MNFAASTDHTMKIKENEKKKQTNTGTLPGKFLKKLWNMNLKVMPLLVGALGTVLKSQEKRMETLELSGRIKTNQVTALLGSARILLKNSRRSEETSYQLHFSERPSVNAGLITYSSIIIIIIIIAKQTLIIRRRKARIGYVELDEMVNHRIIEFCTPT